MKCFRVYNIKELVKILIIAVTFFILIFFAKSNLNSVKTSVDLFINNIFPSLFPFILFTEIILNSNAIDTISKYIGKLIYAIFKLPTQSCSAIIIGFLCGYPMGSKTVAKLYEQGKISADIAKKLLRFVNNCNPIFIISTVGYSIFGNIYIGYILVISHMLSAIIIALFSTRFSFTPSIIHKNDIFSNSFKQKSMPNVTKANSFKNYNKKSSFEILKICIFNAFKTLMLICGFVVIFNLLFSILEYYLLKLNANKNMIAIISGVFEVTKGCLNVSVLTTSPIFKICLISFLLGFSGLCILFQIYSTISMHKFSFKLIVVYKLIQGIISSIITYIILLIYGIPKISSNVFINTDKDVTKDIFLENSKVAYINSIFLIIFALCIYMVISIYYSSKRKKKKK